MEGPDNDRWRGAFTVDRLGRHGYTVRLGRPLRHLAARPPAPDRGRAGRRRRPADRRRAGRDGRRPARDRATTRAPTAWHVGERSPGAEAGERARRGPRRRARRPRPGAHAAAFATVAPELELVVDRERAALLRLVRAVPALARRRTPAGTARCATSSARLPYVARHGLRRPLPAADPPDRPRRTARARTTRTERRPGRPRQPVGDRRRRGRPHRGPPGARHARRLRRAASTRRARARHRGRARHRVPVLARPSVGRASTRSGSGAARTARSSTPRTRPRSTRTSTRSTSRRDDWRALWDELPRRRSRSGSTSGVRDLPRRQPAHQAVRVLGVADRDGQGRSIRR